MFGFLLLIKAHLPSNSDLQPLRGPLQFVNSTPLKSPSDNFIFTAIVVRRSFFAHPTLSNRHHARRRSHRTQEAQPRAGRHRREEGGVARRAHEAPLGVHQEEQSAGNLSLANRFKVVICFLNGQNPSGILPIFADCSGFS